MKDTLKNILFLIFFALTFSPISEAVPFESCQTRNREKFLKTNSEIYEEYKEIKTSARVPPSKRAFWIPGKGSVQKAIFLVHGYMGSPGEMAYLAEPFRLKGWAVVGFLIPGHGSDYEIANAYKMKRASTELKKQLQFVMECFKEVQGVGFSTGGLLLHQFLVEQKAPPQFKGVHFISPLFLQRFGGVFDRLIAQFFDGVSVDLAYATTRFRDIKVMTLDREFYHQNVPMQSGVDIVETGVKVSHIEPRSKVKLAAQLFVSDGDLTVDIYAAKKMISRHYEDVEVIWYKDQSPHHLMAPSVSSRAQDVRSRIYQSVMGQN